MTPENGSLNQVKSMGDLHPHAEADLTDAEKSVRKHIGHAHLVDMYDGGVGRTLFCFRCKRRLGEDRFVPLGPRFIRGRRRPLMGLHPYCHTCREQRKGKWVNHPMYSPRLDRIFSKYTSSLRGGANARHIFFGIDSDDILGKYIEQDGRCALTGLKLDPYNSDSKRKLKTGKNVDAPSVDRINSSKFYTPDNIQIVMLAVNLMKGDMPQGVFVELCHQISVKNLL